VDGSKCISYFTIELEYSEEMKGKFEDWVFGCDICQDVCPWNKFSKPHNEPLFNPNKNVLSKDWDEITEETFRYSKILLKRTKFGGLKRK
jgi:epoxyqueuosine reductase